MLPHHSGAKLPLLSQQRAPLEPLHALLPLHFGGARGGADVGKELYGGKRRQGTETSEVREVPEQVPCALP